VSGPAAAAGSDDAGASEAGIISAGSAGWRPPALRRGRTRARGLSFGFALGFSFGFPDRYPAGEVGRGAAVGRLDDGDAAAGWEGAACDETNVGPAEWGAADACADAGEEVGAVAADIWWESAVAGSCTVAGSCGLTDWCGAADSWVVAGPWAFADLRAGARSCAAPACVAAGCVRARTRASVCG
jgi:hypothetical protein